MSRGLVLLGWFFISLATPTNYTGATIVITNGPFVDQAKCEEMRQWVISKSRFLDVSRCWSDGKP